MSGDPRVTRRAVLLGAVAVVAAACRPKHRAAPPPNQAPDRAVLAEALGAEQALLAEYDAGIGPDASPDEVVTAARAAHADHVRALGGHVGAPTGPATAKASPRADLSRLERRSAQALRRAATSARSGDVAAVLASIAASHEVLAQTRQVGAG
jgi:hypothetical protein